jgi:hypothetical protein
MTKSISALTRIIRRAANRLTTRLTHKASIKFSLTVSLPPFIKTGFAYKTEIGKAAGSNQRRRKLPHTA